MPLFRGEGRPVADEPGGQHLRPLARLAGATGPCDALLRSEGRSRSHGDASIEVVSSMALPGYGLPIFLPVRVPVRHGLSPAALSGFLDPEELPRTAARQARRIS